MNTLWLIAAASVAGMPALAQVSDSTAPRVSVGGFVDGYYAYDSGRPRSFDRAFTTQPARHNEFNLNLGFVEAKLDGARVRGRFALQAGTSVQSNYAGEPALGSVSGPTLSRHIQEAVVGVRVGPKLWIDGGIYLSHIGAEGWISRDNPTYTRSLMADYSPYYQAGVKATWSGSKVVVQLNLLNGWQIISENNEAKSLGARIDWAPSARAALTLYNLIGNEIPDGSPARTRAFQGASLRLNPTGAVTLIGSFDFGWQKGPTGADGSSWYGTAVIGRVQLADRVAVAGRVERYSDPDQVIITTGRPAGFQTNGGSLGLDVAPYRGVLWRTEIRAFHASTALFPDRDASGGTSKNDGFLVTSLGLTF